MSNFLLKMGGYIEDSKAVNIICNGIGGSLLVYIYDKYKTYYGCAFPVVPSSKNANITERNKYRYADLDMKYIYDYMKENGCCDLEAKICGCSNIKILGSTNILSSGTDMYNIVVDTLKKYNIPLVAEDIGGFSGRCVNIDTTEKFIKIKNLNGENKTI